MATISEIFPSAAPVASITLTSLTDAATGASITLPSPPTWTGPVSVSSGNQWSITFSAPTSFTVIWAATVTNTNGSTSPFGPSTVNGDATQAVGMYIAQADLELYIGSITDGILSDPNNAGVISIPGIQQCINQAEARANQKMSWTGLCQYIIPGTFNGVAVNRVYFTGAVDYEFARQLYDLTFCNLIKKRMVLTNQDVDVPQLMKDCDDYFESVGKNEIKLANATVATAPLAANPQVQPINAAIHHRRVGRRFGYGYGRG